MIPNIHKILYTTDLSPNSVYALRYAMNSAIKHDAKIIILHVFEQVSPTTRVMVDLYLDENQRKKIFDEHTSETKDRINRRLKRLYEKEFKGNPECADRVLSIEVSEGFPAEEILRKADELNCDAIIMGTHGKGIVRHTFLGSTSKRVLRRSRIPVCIIPLPKGEIDITFHDL